MVQNQEAIAGSCEEFPKNIENGAILSSNISSVLLEIDKNCIKPTIWFLRSIPSGFVPVKTFSLDTPAMEDRYTCTNSSSNIDTNDTSRIRNEQVATGKNAVRCLGFPGKDELKDLSTFLETHNQLFPEDNTQRNSEVNGVLNTNYTLLLPSFGVGNLFPGSGIPPLIDNTDGGVISEYGIDTGLKERIETISKVMGERIDLSQQTDGESFLSEHRKAVISSEQILNICRLGGINNENIWTALFCSFSKDSDGNVKKKYVMPPFLSNKVIMDSYSSIFRFSEPQSNSIQIYIYCRDIIKSYCSEIIGPKILLHANLFTIWNNSIEDLILNKKENKVFYDLFGEGTCQERPNDKDRAAKNLKSGYTNLYQFYSNLVGGSLPSLLFLKIFEEEFAKFSVLVHLFTRIFGYLDRNSCHSFSSPNLTATSLLYFYKYVFFPFSVSFSAAILNIITVERDYFMYKSLRTLFTNKVYDESVLSSLQRRGEPCLGFIDSSKRGGVCSNCMMETHFSKSFELLSDASMEKLAGRSYKSIIYNIINNIVYVMSRNTNNNIYLRRTNTFYFDSDSTPAFRERGEAGVGNNQVNTFNGWNNTHNNGHNATVERSHSVFGVAGEFRPNYCTIGTPATGTGIWGQHTGGAESLDESTEKKTTNWNGVSKTIDPNKIGIEDDSDSTSGLFWFVSEETDLNIYKTTIEDPIFRSTVFYYTSRLDGIFDVLDLKQCCILINWILVYEEKRIVRIFPKTSYSKFLKVLEDVLFQFLSRKIMNSHSRSVNNYIQINEKNQSNLNSNFVDCNSLIRDNLSTYINNESYCALKLFYNLVSKDSTKQSSLAILTGLLANGDQRNSPTYKKLEFPLGRIDFETLKSNLNLANILGLGCLINGENDNKNITEHFSDRLSSIVYFVHVIYESILDDVLKAMKLEVFNLSSGTYIRDVKLSNRFTSIQIVLSILNKYRKCAKYSFLNDKLLRKFIFKGIYDGLIIYLQNNVTKNYFSSLFTLSFWVNSFVDNRILQIYSFISTFKDDNNIVLLEERLDLYRKQKLHLLMPSLLEDQKCLVSAVSMIDKLGDTFRYTNSKEYLLKFKTFSSDWIAKLFSRYDSFSCEYFNSAREDAFELLDLLEKYIDITELELVMNNVVSGVTLLRILPNSDTTISHYKDRLCKRLLAINCLGDNRLLYPVRNLASMLICISIEYFFLSFMTSKPDSDIELFDNGLNEFFSMDNDNQHVRAYSEFGLFSESGSTGGGWRSGVNNGNSNLNEYKNTSLKSLDHILDDCVLSLFSNSLSTGCFNAFITSDLNWRVNKKFLNFDINIERSSDGAFLSGDPNSTNIGNIEISRPASSAILCSKNHFQVNINDTGVGNSRNFDNNERKEGTENHYSRLSYSNVNLPDKIRQELRNIESSYTKIYPHRKLNWVLDNGFVLLSCIGFKAVYNPSDNTRSEYGGTVTSVESKSGEFSEIEILTSINAALVLVNIGESQNNQIKLFEIIEKTGLPVLDVIRVVLSLVIPGQDFLRISGLGSSMITVDELKNWRDWLTPGTPVYLGDLTLSNKVVLGRNGNLTIFPKLLPIEFFVKFSIDSDKTIAYDRWIMLNMEYFVKSITHTKDLKNKHDLSESVIRNNDSLKYGDLLDGIGFPTLSSKVYRINYPWNVDVCIDDDKYEYFSNSFSEFVGSDDIFFSLNNVPTKGEQRICSHKESVSSSTSVSGVYVYKDNHNVIFEEKSDERKIEYLFSNGGVIFGNINSKNFFYSSCSSSSTQDLNATRPKNLMQSTSNKGAKDRLKAPFDNSVFGVTETISTNNSSNGSNSNLNGYELISELGSGSTARSLDKSSNTRTEHNSCDKKRCYVMSSSQTDSVDCKKNWEATHNSQSDSSLYSSFNGDDFHLNNKRQKLSAYFGGIIELVCKLESIIIKLLKRSTFKKYSEIVSHIQSNWNQNISEIPNNEYINKALIKLIKREFIALACTHVNKETCNCELDLQKILEHNDDTEIAYIFKDDSVFNYVP